MPCGKRIAINDVVNALKDRELTLDTTTYKKVATKARFIDKDHGEFWAAPRSVLKGSGHPARAQEKREATNLKKYGVRTPMQNPDLAKRQQDSIEEKFGVRFSAQSAYCYDKVKKTNLERYGNECTLLNSDVKDKANKTMMEKYGVLHPILSPEIENKIKETNLKRYGKENPLANESVIAKRTETLLNKYGVNHTSKIPGNKSVRIANSIKRYGKENPMQRREVMLKAFKSRNGCDAEPMKKELAKIVMTTRARLSRFIVGYGSKNAEEIIEILGCDRDAVLSHLESLFQPGMSWDNYGKYGWHIDHIVPLSSAKDQDELVKLCHYTNLQPLWAKDNLSKGAKIL